MLFLPLVVFVAQVGLVVGAVTLPLRPSVRLDKATVKGTRDGKLSKFLAIPFAQPPTGQLRFQLPQAVDAYKGTIKATSMGPACPQQAITIPSLVGLPHRVRDIILNSIFTAALPSSEDCLSIDVIAPTEHLKTGQLPVVVWIFGGGFELGGTRLYDGTSIVKRSIKLGKPVIYVAMNYRVSAYGFLAGKEVKDAGVGNLGLHDQRMALKWVQKYIHAFGGDPDKVTIWGQSAGAISVALHMLINDGNHEGLFRGAFMQSGAPIPVGDIEHGQKDYDAIVQKTGCASSADTLACLRKVKFRKLKKAVDASPFMMEYQSLMLAWLPRADGVLFSDNPQRLVEQGKVANIPFVTGNCDDEGTLFSLSQRNVTTNDHFRAYVHEVMLPTAPDVHIDRLMDLYPYEDRRLSDTGFFSLLSPQFGRLAAFQGDVVFQAPRRFFISSLSGKQDIYTYIYKRMKDIPILGSFHTADLLLNSYRDLPILPPPDMQDYLIHFVTDLDPNGNGNETTGGITWPKYTKEEPKMLSFNDARKDRPKLTITEDTFREAQMSAIHEISLEHPI
ncbi:carotenoid ester lipase precursor [Hymenopellis radicata]|nr:carotenoid ester lipase precursor [Hymenopellis radicata]